MHKHTLNFQFSLLLALLLPVSSGLADSLAGSARPNVPHRAHAPAVAEAPPSAAASAVTPPAGAAAPAQASPEPARAPNTTARNLRVGQDVKREEYSYATGVTTIRNFIKNDLPLDIEVVIQGMRDVVAGGDLRMTEKELRAALNSLMNDVRRAQAINRRDLQVKNIQRGQAFIEKFKQRENVHSLPNGVLYRVIKEGHGAKPGGLDSVVVKYRGSSIDGVEFDATEGDNTATLRLPQVINGWREALKNMPVGSKWEIVVPHLMAYGERGVGEVIGPNETLVFEVELFDIKPVSK